MLNRVTGAFSSRPRSRSAVLSRTLGVTAALGVIALLAGCTSPAATSSTADARDKSLVIAENEPPATFDPIQADNSTVDEVVIPAYDTLISYDSSNTLVGSLAKTFSVSSDGLTIDMELNEGTKFHDGTVLTAKDVVYSLDRIKSIGIGVSSLVSSYASSTATDDTHLTITLSQADAPFLAALTRVYIVNSALVEKNAGSDQGQSWLATNDAGSGPYTLTSYTANQSADFAKFPDYWKGFTGQADNVTFNYLADASTEKSALQGGTVDIAMDIAPDDWAGFSSDSNFTVNKSDTNVVLYVFFNMDDATTKNPALREAIATAYNYPQHIESILKGAGKPVDGVLPAGMQCATTDATQPTFDTAAAKKIIDDNGLAGTTVTMTYLQATTEMEQAATLLQSNLKDIGVTLNLEAITYPQYAQEAADPATRPQLGMIYAFPAFPDASAIMYQNFDSQFIGGGQNWGGYSNPTVDSLVQKAQSESDQAARCDDYDEAQKLVTADYATINMANSQTVAIMNTKVKGFTYQPSHHQTVDVYAITVD